ncbi:UDP-N-acetylglucosamine 2-epimerase (non-hydrolyzing) [Candidatus Marinamargulisbacteria bacterium SCGC AG-410-N11]|nr:UDP-N-acetylglucosamine 2-epimerase (non-hydrolyzing) [Candidatus Marinamargulisbacteria bacterium SCGC AG-410-N11]
MIKKQKILHILGARPQFIKLAPLHKVLHNNFKQFILHTGQHYDPKMSGQFFDELNLPKPDFNLEVSGGGHAHQTGRMLMALEPILKQHPPHIVIVYGDTNSTLAGALAASKLNIPIIHVEAGLRSYDWKMPEEQNRVLTDRVSQILMCPTEQAVTNLQKEGIREGVYISGDLMMDTIRQYTDSNKLEQSLKKLKKEIPNFNFTDDFFFLTLHRPSNVDNPEMLSGIINSLKDSSKPILFPVHPRTKKNLIQFSINIPKTVTLVEPLSYQALLTAVKKSKKVITDSGGLQKEACFLGVPCITLRDTTEWVETVNIGVNQLALKDANKIDQRYFLQLLNDNVSCFDGPSINPYGNGTSAKFICDVLLKEFKT